MVAFMQSDVAHNAPCERYVIEIDGIAKAEYQVFVNALKAVLQLKQQFPTSRVKLRDANEYASLPAH